MPPPKCLLYFSFQASGFMPHLPLPYCESTFPLDSALVSIILPKKHKPQALRKLVCLATSRAQSLLGTFLNFLGRYVLHPPTVRVGGTALF